LSLGCRRFHCHQIYFDLKPYVYTLGYLFSRRMEA
jgi:hypothetical protein